MYGFDLIRGFAPASGQLLPALAAGASPPGRVGPHQRGRHRLPARRLHPPSGKARREPGRHPAVEVPGQRDGQTPGRTSRRVPQPAPGRGPYAFVWVDSLPQKVREGGRIINVHALIAVGVNADDHRDILGLDGATAEDGAGWLAFLRSLIAGGLSGVQLVTSDAHMGLVNAIGATLPGASWQRCRTLPHGLRPRVATHRDEGGAAPHRRQGSGHLLRGPGHEAVASGRTPRTRRPAGREAR